MAAKSSFFDKPALGDFPCHPRADENAYCKTAPALGPDRDFFFSHFQPQKCVKNGFPSNTKLTRTCCCGVAFSKKVIPVQAKVHLANTAPHFEARPPPLWDQLF
jgi:hypothetical protein